MRILSVTAQKPHATGSGVYLSETVREFAAMGHAVAVCAGVTHEDRVTLPDRCRFYPVYYETTALPFPVCGMSDEMPYKSTHYRDMSDAMTAQFRAEWTRTLREAVADFRPELILCHHLYLLSALVRELFPDIPVCALCHGSDLRQLRSNALCREEILLGVRALECVFCLHEVQQREIAALFSLPQDKLCVIGSGYNNAVFYPRAEKAAHDACRIIFAGKLSEKKGVCSLIRAMALLPKEQYTLSLAGGFGSEQQRKAIEALIAASDRSIELLGALPQDKLAAAFSEHDVFVLPSFYEGLPLVLSEAMACSLRVVCTDLPGIKAWMDRIAPQHGIRFVAPPTLVDVDTPLPSDLPAFEQHLADAIVSAADAPRSVCDLSALSWRGVAQRILDNL